MNTKNVFCALTLLVSTYACVASAADRPLQPGELEREIANVYGKFSINSDHVSDQACCSDECQKRPGPWKTSVYCSSAASAQSDLRSRLRADLESKQLNNAASKPQSIATTDTPSDASPTDPNRFKTTPPDMTQKVIDMIHPGLGRWERTIGGQHVRVSYMNVKRCRGRDPHHQDVCVGINISTTF